MIRFSIALVALSMFGGCGVDDQAYNIEALTPTHQQIFMDAMEWWNERHPNADFYVNNQFGVSDAVYGQVKQSDANSITQKTSATFKHNYHGIGDRITFHIEDAHTWSFELFCGISRHELGHNEGLYGSFEYYALGTEDHPMFHIAPECLTSTIIKSHVLKSTIDRAPNRMGFSRTFSGVNFYRIPRPCCTSEIYILFTNVS